jgi:hypothetical protein
MGLIITQPQPRDLRDDQGNGAGDAGGDELWRSVGTLVRQLRREVEAAV